MPTDIRSFFGGGGNVASDSKPKKKEADKTKGKRSRKVVEDSDDDEPIAPKKATPQKPKPKPKKESPKGEATTTSDYFAASSKRKPTRSTPVKTKEDRKTSDIVVNGSKTTPRSASRTVPKPESNGRPPSRAKARSKYVEPDSDDDLEMLQVDDNDNDDDIFSAEYTKLGKEKDIYVEDKKGRKSTKLRKQDESDDFDNDVKMQDEDSDDEVIKPSKSSTRTGKGQKGTNTSSARAGRKRKSTDLEEDDFLDDEPVKSSKSKPPAKKSRGAAKAAEKAESKEIQDIFDNIPTVRPPTPPPRDESKKFDYRAHIANSAATPVGGGTADIPTGEENCLAGLAFVFTGVLSSVQREDAQELVKRYGGKVTSAPSSKTSYVVLGADAGPKKLETIKKYGLKTINEQGLFELIRKLPANGGDGKAAEKQKEKKEKEQQRIQEMAAEIDAAEEKAKEEQARAERAKAALNKTGKSDTSRSAKPAAVVNDQLWTTKYTPTSTTMVCGNKGAVEKLQEWLRKWHYNAKKQFRMAGKDGTGVYRTVMIHGPPGIGKTTAAHLVAKLEGYDIVETNASDTRSKKLVEGGLKGVLDTTSLMGYFAGDGKKVDTGKKKLVLIMDEVDGMSAGDRGGVGALASIAKKTHIPMILICNERRQPKMAPFDKVAFDLQFRKPTTEQVRARLMTICFREGLKIPPPVLDALIEGSNADIRRIINMLSTIKMDQETLNFDQGKQMAKAWEKHIILKPWDVAGKILSPGLWAQASNSSINEKIELYFNDHEFSYLMLQENYLKTRPSLASNYHGREQRLKLVELADKAAESISDSDLIDRMIHGSQQQWSLMPAHAVASFVRPACFMHGMVLDGMKFTSWLGQNSKQGKLTRCVKEIQGHMRLRTSADRHEIRQQYLPALWNKLVRPLNSGAEELNTVIDLMDSYFLTKDDWDAMIELGLGPMDESHVKLESKTKAAFTRIYNQRSHPLPFMKASNVVAPKKTAKEKPDLEEAIDDSDVGEEIPSENETKEDDDEELDLKKDKYVKVPKKKGGRKSGGGGGGGGGGGDDKEETQKSKKGKGRGKGKGKA